MRRVFKLVLAGAVVFAAIALVRWLLESDEGQLQAPSVQGPRTRDELYREAARLDIRGRSKMDKRQLQKAVDEATKADAA